MVQVTLADDQKKLRLLQVGVRVADHLFSALQQDHTADDENALAEVLTRWLHLKGDLTVVEFVQQIHTELFPLAGQPIFDSVRSQLSRDEYDYKARIAKLNELGFETAQRCIHKWGGPKARARGKQLRVLGVLPVRCETRGNVETELYYLRGKKPSIDLYPGNTDKLLHECLLLEFNFFHEYLSHAFPNWEADDDRLSEGWLLAIEIEWFKEEYTFLDRHSLLEAWLPRLGVDKRDFQVGSWLLGRCDNKICAKRFMLEWVADWNANSKDVSADLVSQMFGVMKKSGSKLYGKKSAKNKGTEKVLDSQICDPCAKSYWKINKIRDILEKELDRYDTSDFS
jgi:hypothetical protein